VSTEPVLVGGFRQDYDWGKRDGLAEWTAVPTGGPQAELWFGAHPSGPSPVVMGDGTMADRIAGVPLLAKILAAGSPLSLQVHPDAETAEAWARDPTASDLLADSAEKTEMLIAIEPFRILAGWTPAERARDILAAVGADAAVLAALDAADRATAVRLLLGDRPVATDGDGWRRAVRAAGAGDVAEENMAFVADRFGTDRGVAVAALLASDLLAPGDAVYVPAGVPHAYVAGVGFEVMNSSDNVLRLGLTGKRMSVEHSLAAIRDDRSAVIIRAPADHCSAPAGAPFRVQTLAGQQTYDAPTGAYRLVVVLAGSGDVTTDSVTKVAQAGQAIAIPAQAAAARVTTTGHAVVVAATEASQ